MVKKLNECKQEVINEEFGKPFDSPVQLIAEVHGEPSLRTVEFVNNRYPGQPLSFLYHSGKFKNHSFTFLHGGVYTLPEEIIEHVESIFEPVYKPMPTIEEANYEMSARGINHIPAAQIIGKRYFYQFRSVRGTSSSNSGRR